MAQVQTTWQNTWNDPLWLLNKTEGPVLPAPVRSRPSPQLTAYAATNANLLVEARPLTEMTSLRQAWDDLAERALERNVFMEADFALAAGQHLPEGRHVIAVTVSTTALSEPKARLLGVFLTLWPRLPLTPGEVKIWRPELSALGVPLIDKTQAFDVMGAFFSFCAQRGVRCSGVLFSRIPEDSPFAQVLKTFGERSNRMSQTFDRHERAVLRHSEDTQTKLLDTLGAKKAKDLTRLARRLKDQGEVRLERVRNPKEVHAALEDFLALEACGWKGRRGTALIQGSGSATFLRAMGRAMAPSGRIHLDILRLNDQPIAAAIFLESGSRSWFWKIAYDEAYASFSPGVQLTLEASQRQLRRNSMELTDSCAIADHPMINKLWPSRMAVVDIMVATRPQSSPAAMALGAREAASRRLRQAAKDALHRLSGRKKS